MIKAEMFTAGMYLCWIQHKVTFILLGLSKVPVQEYMINNILMISYYTHHNLRRLNKLNSKYMLFQFGN